ncbi:hypothetical protein HanOQP8_Chr02g0042141 [Helianthus annuus]|nr:hypothetical protein HanOQP8_Chr02g0042141 [Helianthus annuus]
MFVGDMEGVHSYVEGICERDELVGVVEDDMDGVHSSQFLGKNGEEWPNGGIEEGHLSVIDHEGIKAGDTFHFYHPDLTVGASSIAAISSHLRSFNRGSNNATGGDKQDVFGGLIFSCCGEEFFGQANINSSPFVDNFPRVTFGGTFCCRVFGRGVLTPYVKELVVTTRASRRGRRVIQPIGTIIFMVTCLGHLLYDSILHI